MRNLALTLVVATLTPWASAASANTLLDLTSIGAGTNNGNFTVGYEFTTTETITVTHLGKFDFAGVGLSESANAAIWSVSGGSPLVTGTVSNTGGFRELDAPTNGVLYRPVTPTVLQPGTYVIGVQSFSGGENYAPQPSGSIFAPGITWNRARAEFGSTLAFPDDIQHTIATAYYGPNLKFANGNAIAVQSYVYDGTGTGSQPSTSPSFPDAGGIELTDGLFPANPTFGNSQWVGFQDPGGDDGTSHPQVTFNLGKLYEFEEAVVTYLHSTTQAGGTITAPEEVLISTSIDGVLYTAPTSYTGFDSLAGNEMRSAFLDITGEQYGQYIRLDFRNASQWTFLSEVTLTGILIPEPSTYALSLIALLGVGLLVRRRRA